MAALVEAAELARRRSTGLALCCSARPWLLLSVIGHVYGDSQQFHSRGFRSGPAQRGPFLYFAHHLRRQVTKHQVRHAVKDLRTPCIRQATKTSRLWRRDLRCHVSARRSGAWMMRQLRHSSPTCSCIVRDAGAGIPFATTARVLGDRVRKRDAVLGVRRQALLCRSSGFTVTAPAEATTTVAVIRSSQGRPRRGCWRKHRCLNSGL